MKVPKYSELLGQKSSKRLALCSVVDRMPGTYKALAFTLCVALQIREIHRDKT